ncbi:MAG: amidohydrolase family protein, partial [Pseudomonadales bacterium]
KSVYGGQGQAPATRMGNVAGFRETWTQAVAYRKKQNAAAQGDGEPPDRDLAMETLAAALDGEIIVHNHCYRADEMAIMLALAREFGFRIAAFHHAVEAYKISDLLAEAGTCSAVWADWWGFKMESLDGIRENAALLDAAGACAIIHSDSEYGIQRLTQEAAKVMGAAARSGVDIPPERALRWVTENAARSLGIEQETGTLSSGKMADIVIWSDNPFSVYARVEAVYVDGARVYAPGAEGPSPVSDFSLGQDAASAVTALAPSASAHSTDREAPSEQPTSSPAEHRPAPTAADFAELALRVRTALDGHTSFVIQRSTVHTGSEAGSLVNVDLLVRDGRIEALGPDLTVDDDVPVLDGTGLRVTPGFFAAAGHIGVGEIELAGDPADAQQRGQAFGAGFDIADAFNPRSLQVAENRIEGVLHAVLAPRPGMPDDGLEGGGVLNGLVAVTGLGLPFEAPTRGVAVAVTLGEMGAWVGGGSRASALQILRQALDEARDYATFGDAWRRGERRDYANSVSDLEALQGVLKGDMPLLVRIDRASDIRSLLSLAEAYRLKLIIEGGAEAWLEAKALASANVPVILSPAVNLPNTFDHLRARRGAATDLSAAGVKIAFTDPDATNHNARNLRHMAGIAVADGMDWDSALRAITLTPAEIFGSATTTGSLERGKDADLVIWVGDPLEPASLPVGVLARGQLLDRDSRQILLRDRYAVRDDQRPPAWRR